MIDDVTDMRNRKLLKAGPNCGKGVVSREIRALLAKKVESCPERADGGPHEFTPDVEYDFTGQTINCEFCGEPQP